MKLSVTHKRGRVAVCAITAVLALTVGACSADSDAAGSDDSNGDAWPGRAIDVVIPTAAGGALDVAFRQIQPFIEEELGSSIAVDYREGGQFTIGTAYTAQNGGQCDPIIFHAVPDIIFSYLTREVPYDYESFAALGGITVEPSALWVAADSQWDSIETLVDAARAQPGSIRVSVSNLTSADNLAALRLEEAAGIDLNIVSYDGGGPARNAVLSGEVEAAMGGVFAAQTIASEARSLLVFQPENQWTDLSNDAPTIGEALAVDLPPIGGTFGFFAAADCKADHPERFDKLAAAIGAASESEGYVAALDKLGEASKTNYLSPSEFDEFNHGQAEEINQMLSDSPELFGK